MIDLVFFRHSDGKVVVTIKISTLVSGSTVPRKGSLSLQGINVTVWVGGCLG